MGTEIRGDQIRTGVEFVATTGADVTVNTASPPTAGQVLTATGATAANWQAPAGGGQTLFDAIVDSSGGGDYTTLGAAISAGELSIYVKGSTTESTITISNSNVRIVGEVPDTTINMGTNKLTLGTFTNISGLTIKTSHAGTGVAVNNDSVIDNCRLEWTANPSSAGALLGDDGTTKSRVRVSNCHFDYFSNASNQEFVIEQDSAASSNWTVTDCTVTGGGTATKGFKFSGAEGVISNLTFATPQGAAFISAISNGDRNAFNNIVGTGLDITTSSSQCSFTGCVFASPVYISNDEQAFAGCTFIEDFTLNSGSDDNVFTGCTFATTSTVTINAFADRNTFSSCQFSVTSISLLGTDNLFSACDFAIGGTVTLGASQIDNCKLQNLIMSTNNARVSNCKVNGTLTASAIGAEITGTKVAGTTTLSDGCGNYRFSGCNFQAVTDNGINNSQFSGCIMSTLTLGSAGSGGALAFSGCIITTLNANAAGNCPDVTFGSCTMFGITLTEATSWVIDGCKVAGNVSLASATNNGIFSNNRVTGTFTLDGDNWTVSNNISTTATAWAVNSTATSPVIVGNKITAAVNINAADTVFNNNRVLGTVTISSTGDRVMANNNYVGASGGGGGNTITFQASSTGGLASSNMTDASVVDSGTNTLTSNVVF